MVSVEAHLCGHEERALDARREALALHDAAGRAEQVGASLRWLSRIHWVRGDGAAA